MTVETTSLLIKREPSLGLYAVSSHPLKQGDLVLEARPYGLSIIHEERKRVCHTCYTIALNKYALSCTECTSVYYCSSSCQDLKQPHHTEFECTAMVDLSNLGPVYRKHAKKVYTIVSKLNGMLLEDAEVYSALDIQDLGRFVLGMISRRNAPDDQAGVSYKDVTKLIRNVESLDRIERQQLEYLYGLLKTLPHSSNNNDTPSQHFTTLLTNHYTLDDFINLICIRTCNGFGLWSFEGTSAGFGIYPAASYFNHSCKPNLMRDTGIKLHNPSSSSDSNVTTFLDAEPRVKFFALHDMEEGAALYHSYIDFTLPRRERQELLRDGYYFECGCERCVNEDEGWIRTYSCPGCSSARIPGYDCGRCGARKHSEV
ncbi:hypothetical protein SmJEL517_g05310 [Synchytrium microbalum]|uniref:SET domain-containing protein n=1 Tax=Synchytrium microbalum TaxID=1806994 RepID=A0A507BVY6_9FUNG|nr:uncharacterized protein SmJEL517_g05310 [Synchytrium microbalum]TPX31358.1 hypothetical protein SmJEL517_g05310 [Synchytrium microbalum]